MRAFSILRPLLALLLAFPNFGYGAPSAFSMTDLDGKEHSLTVHRGKWVLVNLWATWCTPCLTEMPELQALSKARDDLVVLGIAIDGQNPRRVAAFAEKLKVTYPIIAGNDELIAPFNARGYPTSILYSPDGKAVLIKEGIVTQAEIESTVDRSVIPGK